MNDVKRRQIGLQKVQEFCFRCTNARCRNPITAYWKDPSKFWIKLEGKRLVFKRKKDKREVGDFDVSDDKIEDLWCEKFKEKKRRISYKLRYLLGKTERKSVKGVLVLRLKGVG